MVVQKIGPGRLASLYVVYIGLENIKSATREGGVGWWLRSSDEEGTSKVGHRLGRACGLFPPNSIRSMACASRIARNGSRPITASSSSRQSITHSLPILTCRGVAPCGTSQESSLHPLVWSILPVRPPCSACMTRLLSRYFVLASVHCYRTVT